MPGRAGLAAIELSSITAIAAAVMAQPGAAQLGDPPMPQDGQAHYDKKEQVFGRFTVVRNIEDYRAVPMIDFGPLLTKEAQLNWNDSTGRIGFSFVDNGYSVQLKVKGESADGRSALPHPSL